MIIRKVNENDFKEIYELIKQAFKTAKVTEHKEQDFVLKLRAGSTYIPDLEFVAEENGEIIGHIMFTKQKVDLVNKELVGLLVAPLCVKLEYRNKKIGEALMLYGLKKAKQLGYKAAFLIGNPDYYNKFGYKKTGEFGIKSATLVPDEYVLACEIVKGSLNNLNGEINIEE